MAIIATRIDGRLIHGQVANLWITTKLNIGRIMVIDDAVAQNDIEKRGLKLGCPPGVKLSILPIDKAANNGSIISVVGKTTMEIMEPF